MKFSKFILAFAASFLILSQAGAATIVGNLMDIYGGGIDRTIKISPKSTPQAVIYNGTNYTVMDLAKTVSSTNSIFAVVLLGGIYNVDFGTVNGVATPVTKILVPPYDTNTYSFNYVANLATNLGTFVWTNSYGIAAGTNIVITTNGALLVINSAGAGTIYATNVSGLGTAAYSNSTAFDTNGAATAVKTAIISSNYVTAIVTNGLATTNYANTVGTTVSNGVVNFVTNNYISTTQGTAISNSLLSSISATNTATLTTTTNLIANKVSFTNVWVTNGINSGYNTTATYDTGGLGLDLNLSSGGNALGYAFGGKGGTVNIAIGGYITNGGSSTGGPGDAGTVNLANGVYTAFLGGSASAAGTVNIANGATGPVTSLGGTVNIATNGGNTYVGNLTSFGNVTNNGFSIFKTNAYFGGNTYTTNHAYDASGNLLDPEANEYVTASFVRSVLNNGAFLYGTTNTIAVGFSNILTSSTNTVSLQFGANAPSGYTKGFTNFVTGTYPNGPYFASIVSTNTYQAVTGPFVNDFYIQADGSGAGHALGIAPDIFVTYDLTNLIPICAGAEQSLTMAATTNLYTWIQAAAQYNSTNTAGFYIVRRVRVTSQNGTALYINVKGGSGTATTLAFNTPVTVNANYIGTFTGNGSGLTNIPATGIVGTAVTNNASPTFTGLSVGAQTALDVNGNGKFGGVGLTNGVLTGNGSGITNVSASLPSATASLTITNLTVGAPIVYTGGVPTITTNAAVGSVSAITLDPNANNSRFLLTITTGATPAANSNYFTINLTGTPPSTNPVYVFCSAFSNAIAGSGTAAIRFFPLILTSNSVTFASSSTAPAANTIFPMFVQIIR